MSIWFTADTHFGHSNIIKYCNRPYANPEEMEERLLTNFNSRISKGDILYHLGDVAWSSYDLSRFFGQLNTKQVHLIKGNHDRRRDLEYQQFFSWVGEYKKTTVGSVPVVLFHYPIRSWNSKGHGAIHLFGHCHNTLPPHDRSLDCGVDAQDYFPIEFDEVYERTKDIPMYSETNESVLDR